MTFTKGARDLRRRLRPVPVLTQKQLSDKLGVTQQAISAWLRGIAKPDPHRRAALEELTGVAISDWEIEDSADESGEHDALDDAASKAG